MRFWIVAATILVLGCLTPQAMRFDYSSVYVRYTIAGGPVMPDQFATEYVVNNTHVSYMRAYPNGTTSMFREGNASMDDTKALGESIVAAGFYGMSNEYKPKVALSGDEPNAELFVSINGKNKTVALRPYIEDFVPGNIQKIIFGVKSLAMKLQS